VGILELKISRDWLSFFLPYCHFVTLYLE